MSYEAKIPADLLAAIKADPTNVHADVIVQLESPQQTIDSACASSSAAGTTRGQRTTCMVDAMQQFSDDAQAPVKALLDTAADRFASSTFFWINNSVAVKRAEGSLILELAQLDSVLSVRAEQIFQLQRSSRGDGEGEQPAAASRRVSGGMSLNVEG